MAFSNENVVNLRLAPIRTVPGGLMRPFVWEVRGARAQPIVVADLRKLNRVPVADIVKRVVANASRSAYQVASEMCVRVREHDADVVPRCCADQAP